MNAGIAQFFEEFYGVRATTTGAYTVEYDQSTQEALRMFCILESLGTVGQVLWLSYFVVVVQETG